MKPDHHSRICRPIALAQNAKIMIMMMRTEGGAQTAADPTDPDPEPDQVVPDGDQADMAKPDPCACHQQ